MPDRRQRNVGDNERPGNDRAQIVGPFKNHEPILMLFVWSTLLWEGPRCPDVNQLAGALYCVAYRLARRIFAGRSKNPIADAEEAAQTWLVKMMVNFPRHHDWRRPIHPYAYKMLLMFAET